MFWSPLFFVSSLLDIFVTVFPHTFVVAVSDPTFVMQYLLCFLTTISNLASDISLYYNFLNKGPLPIINQTKLVCLYTFILKSTGIAFKLSKRQNTDQSFYIIIRVSQAFGSVSIKNNKKHSSRDTKRCFMKYSTIFKVVCKQLKKKSCAFVNHFLHSHNSYTRLYW